MEMIDKTQLASFGPKDDHLLPLVPHAQNLHHADEDVQKVQLETNALIHHVLLQHPRVGQPRVVQNLLRVVEREASKHGQPAVEPEVLGPHEGPDRRHGQDERREARDGDDGDAGEQGPAEVEVFLLLGRRADEGDGAHHGDGVEAGAGQDGGLHEHERGEDGGLAQVEAAPEGVFLNVAGSSTVSFHTYRFPTKLGVVGMDIRAKDSLIRTRSKRPGHRPDTRRQSHTHDHPRVRRHEPVRPPAPVQGARRHPDDANTQAGVHEGFVEESPFVRRHAAIVPGLAVEHDVRGDNGAANEGGAVKELLGDAAAVGPHDLAARLHVGTTEGLLEGISRFGEC